MGKIRFSQALLLVLCILGCLSFGKSFKLKLFKDDTKTVVSAPKKIAFLFMVYDRLHNEDLWTAYFDKASGPDKFQIFYHQSAETNVSVLAKHGSVKVPKVPTGWGELSLAVGMNHILKIAVREGDPNLHKFVFLSAVCIPVIPFDQMYKEAIADDVSYLYKFMQLFKTPYLHRFLFERIDASIYMKHHQQIMITRKHAELFADEEDKIIELFTPPEGYPKVWMADECVHGTYLKYKGLSDEMKDKKITYVRWSMTELFRAAQFDEIDDALLEQIRAGGFFFARKFELEGKLSEEMINKIISP